MVKSKLEDERRRIGTRLDFVNNEYRLLATKAAADTVISGEQARDLPYAKKLTQLREDLRVFPIQLREIVEKIDNVQAEILAASKDNILLTSDKEAMVNILKLLPNVVYFAASEVVPDTIPISEIKEQLTPQAKS